MYEHNSVFYALYFCVCSQNIFFRLKKAKNLTKFRDQCTEEKKLTNFNPQLNGQKSHVFLYVIGFPLDGLENEQKIQTGEIIFFFFRFF